MTDDVFVKVPDDEEEALLEHRKACAKQLEDMKQMRLTVQKMLDHDWTVSAERMEGLDHRSIKTVLALVAKAYKTYRAVEVLCGSGYGQDAAVAVRTLFETYLATLYLLREKTPERARLLLVHEQWRTYVIYNEWANTPGLASPEITELGAAALENVKTFGAGLTELQIKNVRSHWYGQTTLVDFSKELGQLDMYQQVYRYTSGFAHGADLLKHIAVSEGKHIELKILPGDDQLNVVIPTALVLIAAIADTINDRLGLGFDDELRAVMSRVIRWAPLQSQKDG